MRLESGWCKEVSHFRGDRDRRNSLSGRESALHKIESGKACIRAGVVDLHGAGHEVFELFGSSSKQERAGVFGVALNDFGDEVDAAQPVSLFKIRGGPVRGMVGVGVIKPCDLESAAASFMRDLDQLGRSDLVAVVL